MAETCCRKTCEGCTHKESLGCSGCKAGPGNHWSGECEMAICRKDKGHETCETCSFNATSSTLRERENVPEYRLRKLVAEEDRKKRITQKALFLGKWLWILFWLVIPATLTGFMTNETIVGWFPSLNLPGQILSTICSVAYGLILLKLSSEDEHYRTSGICFLVVAAVSVVVVCISGGRNDVTWTLILTLPAAVVSLFGEYHEYMGHAEVLNSVDTELSEKWRNLWKWYIGLFAALVGVIIVTLIAPILGMLTLLIVSIGILIVSILKLVYLYRTAKLFREYPQAEISII